MIIHVYSDPMCPDEWCAIDEKDRVYGVEARLGVYRNIFKAQLHRGAHPDTNKQPVTIKTFIEHNNRASHGYKVYWFEKNPR